MPDEDEYIFLINRITLFHAFKQKMSLLLLKFIKE